MVELDKVIRALECCLDSHEACKDCYLNDYDGCRDQLNADALEWLKMWDAIHKDIWDRTHEIVRLKKELKAVRAERDTALEKLSWLEKPTPLDNGEYCPPAPREGM